VRKRFDARRRWNSPNGSEKRIMNRLEALEAVHRDVINLSWLVKPRWAAMAGQLITMSVAALPIGFDP
jgi:hypothetical protein